LLSIIILTLNSKAFISPCLDSIFAQDYSNFEVIVVDNGSGDGTPDYIKSNYSQVRLIENKENLGACRARNRAIEQSRGEWILSLDCDVVLGEGFFLRSKKVINCSDGKLGMVQPKILRPDKKTIYSAGIYLSRIKRFYDIGQGREDSEEFNKSQYIFGACCACAFYNRRMLEQIREDTGYFDERFFFLVEDVDLSWRAQRKGWRARFLPGAVCYHYGNSSGYQAKFRQYLCFRNRYLMIKKNATLSGKMRLYLLSCWYEAFRFIYLLINNKYFWRSRVEFFPHFNYKS